MKLASGIIGTVILVVSTSAGAADLAPVKPAAPVAAAPSWVGFYSGFNIGYGFGLNSASNSSMIGAPVVLDNFGPIGSAPYYSTTGSDWMAQSGAAGGSQSGVIGGGQVGYNYLSAEKILLGVEVDFQGAGIRNSTNAPGFGYTTSSYTDGVDTTTTHQNNFTSLGSNTVNAGVNWLGTARGRIGYLVAPSLMVFGTGGLTYGGVYANVNNSGVTAYQAVNSYNDGLPSSVTASQNRMYYGGGSANQTLVGWNAGGGFEWMFMPNWSLKMESIYWNLGNMNVQTSSLSPSPAPGPCVCYPESSVYSWGVTRVNYQGIIARAGVNYHFNTGF